MESVGLNWSRPLPVPPPSGPDGYADASVGDFESGTRDLGIQADSWASTDAVWGTWGNARVSSCVDPWLPHIGSPAHHSTTTTASGGTILNQYDWSSQAPQVEAIRRSEAFVQVGFLFWRCLSDN